MRIGILAFFGFLFSVLISSYLHDLILKIMYESYRREWEKIGRPLGILFFNPDGFLARFDIRRWRATHTFQYRLLFCAPFWIHDDVEGKRLLWIYRFISTLGILSFLAFFVYGV